MALIDDVRGICSRLGSAGWGEIFAAHGLNLAAGDLATELSRPLQIRREREEVQDFSPTGVLAIEPGRPAASLLYHVLAVPDVPSSSRVTAFATFDDLDTLENYIFATAR